MISALGITPADVDQWLRGGWFWYQNERMAAPIPATLYYTEGNDEEGPVRTVESLDGVVVDLNQGYMYPHWPLCGSLNMTRFAVYVERTSNRQYRRTFHSNSIVLRVPRKWDVMRSIGTATVANLHVNSPEIIRALFAPVYYSYSEALRLIMDERWISVALTPHVILVGNEKALLVYRRGKLVGKIQDDHLIAIGQHPDSLYRILKVFEGRVTA